MNVSRLLHVDLSLRGTPRRFGTLAAANQKRRVWNKPLLKRHSSNPFQRRSVHQWTIHCSNADDQTVVDQEEATEIVEEEKEKTSENKEEKIDETKVEDTKAEDIKMEDTKLEETEVEEKYKGPGAELINSMLESTKEGLISTELSESWISSIKEEFGKLEDKIKALNKTTEAKKTELEASKTKYLRLSADFENFRKRADSEREQLRQNTKGDVLKTLLPLIDNFELAKTQTKPKTEGEEAIVGSFLGLYRQITDLFTELGVEAIDCDQKPFDPEFHDAILREPNEDLPDGTVMQELRKGFTIAGKLLRPAMVKVSYSEVIQETELPLQEVEEEEKVVEATLDLDEEKEEAEEAEEAEAKENEDVDVENKEGS
eukprot:g1222.t1